MNRRNISHIAFFVELFCHAQTVQKRSSTDETFMFKTYRILVEACRDIVCCSTSENLCSFDKAEESYNFDKFRNQHHEYLFLKYQQTNKFCFSKTYILLIIYNHSIIERNNTSQHHQVRCCRLQAPGYVMEL